MLWSSRQATFRLHRGLNHSRHIIMTPKRSYQLESGTTTLCTGFKLRTDSKHWFQANSPSSGRKRKLQLCWTIPNDFLSQTAECRIHIQIQILVQFLCELGSNESVSCRTIQLSNFNSGTLEFVKLEVRIWTTFSPKRDRPKDGSLAKESLAKKKIEKRMGRN